MNNKTLKIHFFYILLILISIIIVLLTVEWVGIPNLTDYITFALTITSIVLAILAIVYAFFSNSSFTKNIVSLNDSSKIISDASKIITESSKELNEKIEDIPILLKKIDEKTDHTIIELDKIKKRPQSTPKIDNVQTEKYSFETVQNLLQTTSINGLKCLLIAKYSFHFKKDFDLDKTCNQFELSTDYFYAFLMPLLSLGFLKNEHVIKNLDFHWKVTELNEHIISQLDKEVEKTNKRLEEDSMEILKISISSFKEYFENL